MNLTLVIELAVFMHAGLPIELWLRYAWLPLIILYACVNVIHLGYVV